MDQKIDQAIKVYFLVFAVVIAAVVISEYL